MPTRSRDKEVKVSFSNWVLGGSLLQVSSTERQHRASGKRAVVVELDSDGEELKAVADKKETEKEKKEPEKEKVESKKEEPKKKKRHCRTCHKERMTDDESEVKAKKDSPKKGNAKKGDAGGKDKEKMEKARDKKVDDDKKPDVAEKDDSASKKDEVSEKATELKKPDQSNTATGGNKSAAGEWTAEQDAKLLSMKASGKNNSWADIGKEVGHPGKPNCYDRYKELTSNGGKSGDGDKAAEKEKEAAVAIPGMEDIPADAWIGGPPGAWSLNDAGGGEDFAADMTGGIDENFGADLFTGGPWGADDSGGNGDTPAQDSGKKGSNKKNKKQEEGKKGSGNGNGNGNSNSASNMGDATWGNNPVDTEPTGPCNNWGDETPADTTWGNNPLNAEPTGPTNNWGDAPPADAPAEIPVLDSGGEHRSNWNIGRDNHFGGGYNTGAAHGRLQVNNIWSTADCEVLEMLEARYTEHKWLHMQAEFYNWTGRMVTAEMIWKKFKKDGCA